MKRVLGALLIMCFSSMSLLAQEFDHQQWEALKLELNYANLDSIAIEEQILAAQSDSLGTKQRELARVKNRPREQKYITIGPLLQIVVIILFIFMVLYLIVKLLNIDLDIKNPKKIRSMSEHGGQFEMEELPEESDMKKWLRGALKEGDYKLALRIHFLMIINSLEQLGLIKWKKDKTNRDYLYELDGHSFSQHFELAIDSYNQVYFGEKLYSDEVLKKMVTEIENIRTTLDSANS